jgi:hypothetical protein
MPRYLQVGTSTEVENNAKLRPAPPGTASPALVPLSGSGGGASLPGKRIEASGYNFHVTLNT